MVEATRRDGALDTARMVGAGLLPSGGWQAMWEGLLDGVYSAASRVYIACFAVAALMGWVGRDPRRVGSMASLQCSRVGGVPGQFGPIACTYSR